MAYLLSIPTNVLVIFCSFLFLFYNIIRISRNNSRNKSKRNPSAPAAGGGWPLIGHLHLLTGPEPPHIVLGNMADKYGPIFTIKMGVHPTLVVSNGKFARECFTTNDKAFANRPNTLAIELLSCDRVMFAFSPYGPFWSRARKLATAEFLSNQRLQMFKDVREAEVRTLMKELHRFWELNKNSTNKVPVEMRRWLGDVTLNVILRIIVGRSVGYDATGEGDQDGRMRQVLREFFEKMGMFVVSDALPCLRRLDIGGHEKAMRKTAEEMNLIAEEWLADHKQKKVSGSQKGEDFMDLMLNIPEEGVAPGHDSDSTNKATCLTLILAGSDAIAVTLIWALSLLLNHPDALKKVQQELDAHIGRERQATESDLKNLVYLQAVVKETLRLYPAGPLGLPHESLEDCTVGDYHIPAGTRLIVNIWKIHRDPNVWSNPLEFQPGRFLTTYKYLDVRGQNFEYIPFGSGRRTCAGVSFAIQVAQLILAQLLHGFNFATPHGEPTDMSESIGLSDLKATPLDVLIHPRLPSHLYG